MNYIRIVGAGRRSGKTYAACSLVRGRPDWYLVVPDGRHAEWVITHERLPRKKVWLASDVQSKLLSMRGIRLVLDEVRPEELGSVAPGAVIVAATENEWAQVQPWRNDTAC